MKKLSLATHLSLSFKPLAASLLCLSLLAPTLSNAQWVKKSGNTVEAVDERDLTSDHYGTFGAKIILIRDLAVFKKEWNQTDHIPKIDTVDFAGTGQDIISLVLVSGCVGTTNCDVVVSYTLSRPGQSPLVFPEQTLYNGPPSPRPGVLLLSQANLKNAVTSDDPRGKHTLTANITDKNSGRKLKLETFYNIN